MGDRASEAHWELCEGRGIEWRPVRGRELPHEDHVEMSGRKVSLIARYGVDRDRRLSLSRHVVWPMLRLTRDDVRGYLVRDFGAEVEPRITMNGRRWEPGRVALIRFDGILQIAHEPADGITLTRSLFASPDDEAVVEMWTLELPENDSDGVAAALPALEPTETEGIYGAYRVEAWMETDERREAGRPDRMQISFGVRAQVVGSPVRRRTADARLARRTKLLRTLSETLTLETPEPALDRMFEMAKVRAAESVFETRMGLVHSPGGGRYYGGIWANDQAEYSGPLFAFLGEPGAREAALQAYRIYATRMTPDYEMLPSSFEVEGDVLYHAGGDRGDAAMVAYGASRFALANGDRAVARELWPSIRWCLEYCRRKTNAAGVVESDTDELEGRFPTGTANLSTSSLAYGALRSASFLAADLGISGEAADCRRRAADLREAIERHFGAEVEGYATYRYFEGCEVLRAWICLPLVMGIDERAHGTVDALFSPRLWTPDGLATQAGDTTFWDRSTLYALRGVLAAGETETALAHLLAYTERRLLGDHVPYAVEAWPEGGQAHLSAESALYCRIFTEGLFGIEPTGLRAFRCRPRLPEGWDGMALRHAQAFGGDLDVIVERTDDGLCLTVERDGRRVVRRDLAHGDEAEVRIR